MNNTSEIDIKSTYEIKTVNGLLPGDIILHPIYRDDGLMLINQYTTLSSATIRHVKVHLNDSVKIIVANSQEQITEFQLIKAYSSKTYIDDLKSVVDSAKEDFHIPTELSSYLDTRVKSIEKITETVNVESDSNNDFTWTRLVSRSPLWNSLEIKLESARLQIRAKDIKEKIQFIICRDECMLRLVNSMIEYDELLLLQGVNSLCISMLLGLTLELTDDELLDLATAALFCNIGYLKIERSTFRNFLQTPTDLDSIKSHVRDSLELLTGCRFGRKKSIIYGILDHHECYDGSGFPVGKSGDEISLFGRILAIANAYDDLVGSYFDDDSITSSQAINRIWENKEMKFDSDILRVFMNVSTVYKIGQPFIFSKTERGVIIGFTNYAKAPHKPIVKLSNGTIKDFYNE